MHLRRVLAVLALPLTLTTDAYAHAHASSHVHFHRRNPLISQQQSLDDAYDYVVVGSGPGGGPAAADLAVAGYKVLLIDAGGDQGDNLYESVPALWPRATDEFPESQWNYFVTRSSDPAEQAKDPITSYRLPDGSIFTGLDPPADATAIGTLYPRAGTLGGCSRHNALITVRAFDSDWEAVAEITGDTSWNGTTFQRLFEQIEHCDYLPNSVVGHGFNGWLWTELTSLVWAVKDLKLVSIVASAASAMGRNLVGMAIGNVAGLTELFTQDLNAPGPTIASGLYLNPLSMKESVRGGVRDRILQVANAVDADGNRLYHLDIKLHTLVTRIQFDRSSDEPRATGVEYLEGEALYRADPRSANATIQGQGIVNASKEIIIAAGTFNTPQLLKLSGIGPAEELARFGIDQFVDLPVGSNLRDHIEVPVISKAPTNFTVVDGCTFVRGYPEVPDPCLERYLAGHDQASKGAYGSNGLAIGAIMKTSAAAGDDPDVMVYGGPANSRGFFPGWAHLSLDADHQHWVWISLKASTQNTAGTVMLSSADPRDTPIIAFNTFGGAAAERDLQASFEGIEFARRAMDDLVPLDGSFTETQPGRANVSTEDEIKEYVATNSFGHHACCTAPIGTVLDSKFRVKGVAGLRVVDASAFPVVPGFFIQLPTYLLSAKAGAAILEDA